MVDTILRLLEIVVIFLPLTGIFAQLSFRLIDSLEIDDRETDVLLIQLVLLAAAMLLTLLGVVLAAGLMVRADDLFVGLTGGFLYIAFLLLGAAIAAVFALAHPRIPVVGQQQTLSEQGNKTDTEE